MLERFLFFTLIVVAFIIGIFVGKIFYFPGVTMATALNPLHGVSILTSLFVAIFIGYKLNRTRDEDKCIRDILFKVFGDVCSKFERIESLIAEDSPGYQDVVSSIKSLAMAQKGFEEVLLASQAKMEFDKETFQALNRDLRTLLTCTPIKPKKVGAGDLVVKKNQLIIGVERLGEVQSLLDKFRKAIFVAQIRIAKI